MKIITDWESAVNFVFETGESFIHPYCILNKNYNFIEVHYKNNSLSFPVKEAIKFLNANLTF